jgi:exonuclease SbcC
MRIETVELENIRSHINSTVTFNRGFNCLVGGLGRGKSSILYAIDFALFGDPLTRSYEYLLREGANAGKVTLKFVHAGKTYTLTRALKRRGKGVSQDAEQLKFFEEDKLIASVKNEAVAEQLKAITALDKEIFREIIWVRQEHLKELLDVAPRERQKRLDQLFGLSDYEVAWSNLAAVQRDYETERKVYEKDYDVVGREKLQVDYNTIVQDFATLENELQDLRRKVVEAEIAFNEAAKKLQSLEELRKQTEELQKKEARLQANLINIEDINAKLAEEIEKKKGLAKELEQRLKSLETQENSLQSQLEKIGLNPNQTLEELRLYLSSLNEQMSSLRGESEATRKEMQASQKRVQSLAKENKCPLCLQPLSEQYKENLQTQLNQENIERERRLSELQKNMEELERLYTTVNNVVGNLQLIVPRKEDLKTRISEERDSLKNLAVEFEQKQLEETEIRSQLAAVREEIKRFDLAELESARKLRDRAFEHYSGLKSKVEIMESRKRDMAQRIDDLKERLDRAQEKVERMEKIGKLLEIINGIRNAYRSIQPRLRSEFVTILERVVQQVLDSLVGTEGYPLVVEIDETYTPFIKSEEGYQRDSSNLSGGERTLLAFAYRLGLGQLILQSRMGQSLNLLLLDEPTESLGREDGSVDRLAEAISRLKSIEQIIAVTHSEAFAEKAEHVIRLEKEAGVSKVSMER